MSSAHVLDETAFTSDLGIAVLDRLLDAARANDEAFLRAATQHVPALPAVYFHEACVEAAQRGLEPLVQMLLPHTDEAARDNALWVALNANHARLVALLAPHASEKGLGLVLDRSVAHAAHRSHLPSLLGACRFASLHTACIVAIVSDPLAHPDPGPLLKLLAEHAPPEAVDRAWERVYVGLTIVSMHRLDRLSEYLSPEKLESMTPENTQSLPKTRLRRDVLGLERALPSTAPPSAPRSRL